VYAVKKEFERERERERQMGCITYLECRGHVEVNHGVSNSGDESIEFLHKGGRPGARGHENEVTTVLYRNHEG